MKFRWTRLIPSVAAMTIVGLALVGVAHSPARAQAPAKPQMAEDVFKNIQALKGISVDDFMGTMGLMSAGVGFDCSECHTGAGTDKVNWAADTPNKVMARKMVRMVESFRARCPSNPSRHISAVALGWAHRKSMTNCSKGVRGLRRVR